MICGFARLGKEQGHSWSFDRSSESMRTLKAKVQEIWSDYIAEFPLEQVAREVPGAMSESRGEQRASRDGDHGHEPDRYRARVPVAFGRMGAGVREGS